MCSPSAGSTWDAGAMCAVQGGVGWLDGTDQRPTGVTVYVLAGGGETTTNSDFADLSNIVTNTGAASEEDCRIRIALTAANPTIG